MFLKLPFAVSFSVLFITIQYAVFRISFRTFHVSLYIYIDNESAILCRLLFNNNAYSNSISYHHIVHI